MAPKMKSLGLTLLIRMHPNVGHGLTFFREPDHADRPHRGIVILEHGNR